MIKAEDCPFCGGAGHLGNDYPGGTPYVFCLQCGARGPEVSSDYGDNDSERDAQAIYLWNGRIIPEEPVHGSGAL